MAETKDIEFIDLKPSRRFNSKMCKEVEWIVVQTFGPLPRYALELDSKSARESRAALASLDIRIVEVRPEEGDSKGMQTSQEGVINADGGLTTIGLPDAEL
jgi:hypothetical protein